MNATPKTMARHITVARQGRAERARVARMAPVLRVFYSSTTGQAPVHRHGHVR